MKVNRTTHFFEQTLANFYQRTELTLPTSPKQTDSVTIENNYFLTLNTAQKIQTNVRWSPNTRIF